MKIRIFIECDNDKCKNVAQAEMPDTWITEEELKKIKSVSPPYGWLISSTQVFGSGPDANVVVCSSKCLSLAIEDELEKNH